MLRPALWLRGGLAAAALAPLLRAVPVPDGRVLADYDDVLLEPRPRADGRRHVDTPDLIARLRALHANTYFYLVNRPGQWEDLAADFLPAAERAGIDVWAYFTPPSEARPEWLPFGYDYVRTARETAALALRYPGLRGLVIDDFAGNTRIGAAPTFPGGHRHRPRIFTPQYVARMRAAARAVNPHFRFYPLLYEIDLHNRRLIDTFAPDIDGAVFAYCDEPTRNALRADTLAAQLRADEAVFSTLGKALILMVYCRPIQIPLQPSVGYVRDAVDVGLDDMRRGALAGVVTYSLDLGGPGLPVHPIWAPPNDARTGNGRGVLAVSTMSPLSAGSYGELRTTASVDPASTRRRLTFWRRAVYPGWGHAPACRLQALWNGHVVWEASAVQPGDGALARWRRESIAFDGPPAKGVPASLAFRLVLARDERAVLTVSLDDLAPEGFAVPSPGFERPADWRPSASSAGFLPLVVVYRPDDTLRMFNAVAKAYGAFAGQP